MSTGWANVWGNALRLAKCCYHFPAPKITFNHSFIRSLSTVQTEIMWYLRYNIFGVTQKGSWNRLLNPAQFFSGPPTMSSAGHGLTGISLSYPGGTWEWVKTNLSRYELLQNHWILHCSCSHILFLLGMRGKTFGFLLSCQCCLSCSLCGCLCQGSWWSFTLQSGQHIFKAFHSFCNTGFEPCEAKFLNSSREPTDIGRDPSFSFHLSPAAVLRIRLVYTPLFHGHETSVADVPS